MAQSLGWHICMDRPCVASRMWRSGDNWSGSSVFGPLKGAFCSRPSWISAHIRSHSRQGPRRPYVPPNHGCDGQTVSPSPQSNSQTSAGIPYSWLLTLVAHFRASFRRPYAVQLRRCRLDARFVTASLNQDGQSDPCQLVGERDYQNIAM